MSLADRIRQSHYYVKGEPFSVSEMMSVLNINAAIGNRTLVTEALTYLTECGDLQRCEKNKFKRGRKHWIHTKRLANPVSDTTET